MVMNGFSILELRKLFIDEFYSYYAELIYNLEQSGQMKKGAYRSVSGVSKKYDPQETVKSLKAQIFKGINKKKK